MLKNLKIFDVWFFSLFEWILAPYWSDWFLSKIVIRHCDDVLCLASLNWKSLNLPQLSTNKKLRGARIWSSFGTVISLLIWWNGLLRLLRTIVRKIPFLLFTSICPPRKIRMLWSLKISPCILKFSGIFKLSEIFEFSLLPVSWFADFSRFSSTIKYSYNWTVGHMTIFPR